MAFFYLFFFSFNLDTLGMTNDWVRLLPEVFIVPTNAREVKSFCCLKWRCLSFHWTFSFFSFLLCCCLSLLLTSPRLNRVLGRVWLDSCNSIVWNTFWGLWRETGKREPRGRGSLYTTLAVFFHFYTGPVVPLGIIYIHPRLPALFSPSAPTQHEVSRGTFGLVLGGEVLFVWEAFVGIFEAMRLFCS